MITQNITTHTHQEYQFEADSIEKTEIWKSQQIPSLLNYCCAETFIKTIKDGQVILEYKFRIPPEGKTDNYGKKTIYYTIDSISGKPVMTNIE